MPAGDLLKEVGRQPFRWVGGSDQQGREWQCHLGMGIGVRAILGTRVDNRRRSDLSPNGRLENNLSPKSNQRQGYGQSCTARAGLYRESLLGPTTCWPQGFPFSPG